MRKIGELFLLRTNINSVGSVLDSPVRLLSSLAALIYELPPTIVGGLLGEYLKLASYLRQWGAEAIFRPIRICSPFTMPQEATWRFPSV